MKIVKCEQGHFYDADTYDTCPHCINGMEKVLDKNDKPKTSGEGPENGSRDIESNVSHAKGFSKWLGGKQKEKEDSVTMSFSKRKEKEPTKEQIKPEEKLEPEKKEVVSGNESLKNQIETSGINKDDIKTIGFFGGGISDEPVVGWLVALTGGDKGHSFELIAGKNHIGRFATMNVVLAGDPKVSREKHATIMYEPRARKFFVLSNECSGMVYLNDEIVMENKEIKNRDKILVGDTTLLFVPLCGDDFSWDEIEG